MKSGRKEYLVKLQTPGVQVPEVQNQAAAPLYNVHDAFEIPDEKINLWDKYFGEINVEEKLDGVITKLTSIRDFVNNNDSALKYGLVGKLLFGTKGAFILTSIGAIKDGLDTLKGEDEGSTTGAITRILLGGLTLAAIIAPIATTRLALAGLTTIKVPGAGALSRILFGTSGKAPSAVITPTVNDAAAIKKINALTANRIATIKADANTKLAAEKTE